MSFNLHLQSVLSRQLGLSHAYSESQFSRTEHDLEKAIRRESCVPPREKKIARYIHSLSDDFCSLAMVYYGTFLCRNEVESAHYSDVITGTFCRYIYFPSHSYKGRILTHIVDLIVLQNIKPLPYVFPPQTTSQRRENYAQQARADDDSGAEFSGLLPRPRRIDPRHPLHKRLINIFIRFKLYRLCTKYKVGRCIHTSSYCF
ncbi:hypothetical protein DPMN_016086 [Dreissena polymorpha]|uniref:Uncharacterized protein n=1 Tax=Dreissena polymorpha TaxID=45954 RepID=A0A9D4S539_DREPO|nr:hypothetical protein DPMN_016086 [Dreissena polymorpha]